jgi:hypothetical protein
VEGLSRNGLAPWSKLLLWRAEEVLEALVFGFKTVWFGQDFKKRACGF